MRSARKLVSMYIPTLFMRSALLTCKWNTTCYQIPCFFIITSPHSHTYTLLCIFLLLWRGHMPKKSHAYSCIWKRGIRVLYCTYKEMGWGDLMSRLPRFTQHVFLLFFLQFHLPYYGELPCFNCLK